MGKMVIKPFNVVDQTELPEIVVDQSPSEGDPVEIEGELYYVCEINCQKQSGQMAVGLLPLVVRDPTKVKNIEQYLKCLSIAHRKVLFRNEKGCCDFDSCNEMIIS
jgi:hypothetical protein